MTELMNKRTERKQHQPNEFKFNIRMHLEVHRACIIIIFPSNLLHFFCCCSFLFLVGYFVCLLLDFRWGRRISHSNGWCCAAAIAAYGISFLCCVKRSGLDDCNARAPKGKEKSNRKTTILCSSYLCVVFVFSFCFT